MRILGLPREHESLRIAATPRITYPPLPPDGVTVDVAIVGGGIAGITTAWLLKRRGLRVAVLEAGVIVETTAGHTTAALTSQHGLIYDELTRTFDAAIAARYGEANEAAITFVADTVAACGIACDFVRGPAYTYTRDAAAVDTIRAEVAAARAVGLPAQFVTDAPLPFPIAAAVRFDDQALFHPRKYLLHLARKIDGGGSYVFERTRATNLDGDAPFTVSTEHGAVSAGDVVIAAQFPLRDTKMYFARVEAHTSYEIAASLYGPVPRGMYGAADSSRSLRRHVEDGREFLVFGGEGHETGRGGDTIARYRRLEAWARATFPVAAIHDRWVTQDDRTFDRIPFIGPAGPGPRRLFVATGFNGWGMTSGTVAAMLLADLITGQDNPWAAVFRPARVLDGPAQSPLPPAEQGRQGSSVA